MGDGVGRPVVQPRQELEVFNGQLTGRDSQLVVELANGGVLDSHDGSVLYVLGFIDFSGFHAVERMGTASVGPDLTDIIIISKITNNDNLTKTNIINTHITTPPGGRSYDGIHIVQGKNVTISNSSVSGRGYGVTVEVSV